ncbi:MAG: protein phosphatase 2C domain-containing protein [Gammaproteobacteria bacterium]|nr:protein phosphatase 2C domain-containing protein [Gammaproteobacteria bacterium]
MIKINVYGGTDRGKVRANNQDSICFNQFNKPSQLLAIVADGVGGHAGGDVASKLAVNVIEEHFRKAVMLANSGAGYSDNWCLQNIDKAIQLANQEIKQQQGEDERLASMATTVVMLVAIDDTAGFSYLGDSRLYGWRDNCLNQLSKDHTVAQQMIDDGVLTDDQASMSPYHHVLTRGLGIKGDIDIVTYNLNLQSRDIYLLCSDGLTNCLSDDAIEQILASDMDIKLKVDELIAAANDNGGHDNISVVLVECE